MAYIDPDTTIRALLEERAAEDGDKTFCVFEEKETSYASLNRSVNRIANGLLHCGIRPGDRVAVMLAHHPDHICTFFALAKIGAVSVPINVHLKGASLEFLLEHCEPKALIVDDAFADSVLPALDAVQIPLVISRGGDFPSLSGENIKFENLAGLGHEGPPPSPPSTTDDVLIICYTSGTTGAPKGVLVTDKMCRTAATSACLLSGIQEGDVPLFWEPIYHLFGIEVLVLAVMKPVKLAMVERFSASRFWEQAKRHGATHIHYVGGVLQLLLKQPSSRLDREHGIQVAWGGGCPTDVWTQFEERFGVEIRDSFGMTETAALNIVNMESVPGAVGRPLPYFDVRIVNADGNDLGPNQIGELLIREKEPGLIMKGYFKHPEATAAALNGGWMHTGDLVKRDEEGIFYFCSRKKDSVRRRGENISAWEVERVVNAHPEIEESALVGVVNEFGDEDLKIFVKPVDGRGPDPNDLIRWCEAKMARFQVPRFIAFTDGFDKTPTERIRKGVLSRSIDDCWDRERAE